MSRARTIALVGVAVGLISGFGLMSGSAAPPPEPDHPTLDWLIGKELVMAFAQDRSAVAGYSNELGVWVWQTLDPKPVDPVIPIIGGKLGYVMVGDRVYAYSSITGLWSTAKISSPEPPMVYDNIIMAVEGPLTHCFSATTGKWSTLDTLNKTSMETPKK